MKESWIPREYQGTVVRDLYKFGLLKFDNDRKLPLKSGGMTDVYINLRDARDNPDALYYLAELFSEPLQRLEVDRFVEVPDSVSCFAGPLAIRANIPYLTIREEAKEGRVAKGKIIGHAAEGETICLVDDVITDGASKVVPFYECTNLGLDIRALVVLVDRQQGWKGTFGQNGCMNLRVWAGMTLHDLRRELITLGLMKRCDPKVEEKNPLVIALDGKSWEEILPIVDQLRTTGCILKVNDLVFAEGLDHLLPELSVYGRVMVDLKCHDIPNTVENTCKRLAKHNVWAVTVHASGGGEMIKAAIKALAGTDTKVLAISALTSLGDEECMAVYDATPRKAVKRLAAIAQAAGAHGLVCSPHEISEVKSSWPDCVFVTPGIRSEDNPTNDQQRIATPSGAIEKGATHLVMGRQILGAKDPIAEVHRVLNNELKISLP